MTHILNPRVFTLSFKTIQNNSQINKIYTKYDYNLFKIDFHAVPHDAASRTVSSYSTAIFAGSQTQQPGHRS
jgi:hypothetical protein